MAELTPQQQLFCQKYIECKGNASEAYRQSYNCEESNNHTLRNEAYRLLQNPDITQTIETLQEELREELNYTVTDAMNELQDAIQFAKQNGQAAAVISAIKAKIDMFGLDAPKKVNIEGTLAEWMMSLQGRKD